VTTPSFKGIVPVPEDGVTVAVRVMPDPNVDGLRFDASAVVLVAWFTTWLTGLLVLVMVARITHRRLRSANEYPPPKMR